MSSDDEFVLVSQEEPSPTPASAPKEEAPSPASAPLQVNNERTWGEFANDNTPIRTYAMNGIHYYIKNGVSPCLLYTSPSPRDGLLSRMPSSA